MNKILKKTYAGVVIAINDKLITVRYRLPNGDPLIHEYEISEFENYIPNLYDRLRVDVVVELSPKPEVVDNNVDDLEDDVDDGNIRRGPIYL